MGKSLSTGFFWISWRIFRPRPNVSMSDKMSGELSSALFLKSQRCLAAIVWIVGAQGYSLSLLSYG